MKFIKQNRKNLIMAVLLLLAALFSVLVISKMAAKPENYGAVMQLIDDKKAAVMSVTAGAAAVSTLLGVIPGDAAASVANQIMQISSYLMIVVCVLVLEKTLLTVMGYLSFRFLIPLACGLLGVYIFYKRESLRRLALRLIALAVVLTAIIPVSVKIGDMIYESNAAAIEAVTATVEEAEVQSDDEGRSWVENTIKAVKERVAEAGDYAKQKLNQFIDAVAVFIVAYCVIPILAAIAMLWLIKSLFGIKIPLNRLKKKSATEMENKFFVV